MKFKINLKPPKNPEIGDVIEIGGACYVITEFQDNDNLGKRIWGKPINSDKLTHICGLEFFKEHIITGKIKLVEYV